MSVCLSTISIETVIAAIYPNLLFSDWDWGKFHNLAYNRNGNTSSIIVIAFLFIYKIILVLLVPPFS